MFDIGFSELLMVGIVALLVLGPEKLPVAARTCGLWVGRLRRSISSIQREISEELRVEELRRTAAIQKEKLDQELSEMRQPFTSSEMPKAAADPEAEAPTQESEEPAAESAAQKASQSPDKNDTP